MIQAKDFIRFAHRCVDAEKKVYKLCVKSLSTLDHNENDNHADYPHHTLAFV